MLANRLRSCRRNDFDVGESTCIGETTDIGTDVAALIKMHQPLKEKMSVGFPTCREKSGVWGYHQDQENCSIGWLQTKIKIAHLKANSFGGFKIWDIKRSL